MEKILFENFSCKNLARKSNVHQIVIKVKGAEKYPSNGGRLTTPLKIIIGGDRNRGWMPH